MGYFVVRYFLLCVFIHSVFLRNIAVGVSVGCLSAVVSRRIVWKEPSAVLHSWLSVVGTMRISVFQPATVMCGGRKLKLHCWEFRIRCLVHIYKNSLYIGIRGPLLSSIDDSSAFY